jgi:hypothetical protein
MTAGRKARSGSMVRRLDPWVHQDAQDVAPIMMPAEFIEEALVGPIFQAAVPQLIGQFGLQRLRLVGVQTSKSYCFFLTNLPPRVGPRQVADLYRVRWEVELSIKLDKSVHRLDAIDAERPCSLKTLLHASLIASILAALLAHTHNLQTRPTQVGAPWHRSTPGSWPCSWPSPVSPSPRPSICQEPRPHNAGTRSRSCSHMPGEIPTGDVGRPYEISCEVGNASRLLESKTVRTVHRWQLK